MTDNVTHGQKRPTREILEYINDDCLVNSLPPSKKPRESSFRDLSNISTSKTDLISDKQKFFLVITNLSGRWTCEQVINYVKEECGVCISNIKDSRDSLNQDFQIKLKFETKGHRSEVLDKLKVQEAEGNLCVEIKDHDIDDDSYSGTTVLIGERNATEVQFTENNDAWEPGPKGVYDLKESYLETLGVTPPLSNWVTVTNFRCDKSELKEVLELAGHVVVCSVITVSSKQANVMYSHPLEAVQAISMLNNQSYYGKNLKIVMNKTSDCNQLLPKGLVGLGPGLGKYGKPIRDVIKQYERCLNGKESLIDTKLFAWDKSADEFSTNLKSNSSSPHNNIMGYKVDVTKEEKETNSEISRHTDQDSSSTESNIKLQFNKPITNNSMQITDSSNTYVALKSNNQGGLASDHQSNIMQGRSEIPLIPRFNYMTNLGPNVPVSNFFGPNSQGVPTPQIALGVGQIMPRAMPNMSSQGGYDTSFTNRIQTAQGPRIGYTHGQSMQAFPGPTPRPHPGPLTSMNIGNVMAGGMPRFSNSMIPNGPIPGPPIDAQNMPGPNRYMQQPVGDCSSVEIYRGMNNVSLKVTNIPPSLNLVGLCDRLSKFGQVTALEMVNPTLANVKFAMSSEAERCFQQYRFVFQ